MKKAWMYVCIPPMLGILVFLLVKWVGTVPVPTVEEINAAIAKEHPSSGGIPQYSREELQRRLAAALRGEELDDRKPASGPSEEVKPDSNSSSEFAEGSAAAALIKQREEGTANNARWHKRAAICAITVMVIGYAVVGYWFYLQFKTPSGWQEALAASKEATGGTVGEEDTTPFVEDIPVETAEARELSEPAVQPADGEIIFIDDSEAKSEYEVEQEKLRQQKKDG